MDKKQELSLKSNILWNTFGNVIYLILQWLMTIVIVRITDYNQLGLFSLAMSITNIGFSICGWGIRNYQVSDIKYKYLPSEYIFSRFLTCSISLVCIIIYSLVGGYSHSQISALILYMLFRIGESLIDVIHGIFQQEQRMDIVGKSFIIRGLGNFIILVIILKISLNINYAILGIVGFTIFILIFWDCHKLFKLNIPLNKKNPKKSILLIIECIPLAIHHILFTSYATIPRIFLEKFHNQEALGILTSINTPVVIIQAMCNFIMIPYATVLADLVYKKAKQQLIKKVMSVLSIITLLGLIASVMMKFFGNWGLNLLYGEEVATESALLQPSVVAVILVAYCSFFNILLIVFRQKYGLLIANFFSLLTALTASQALILGLSLYGTVYTHILTLLTHLVIIVGFTIYEIIKC